MITKMYVLNLLLVLESLNNKLRRTCQSANKSYVNQKKNPTHIHIHYCQLRRPNKLDGAKHACKNVKCNKKSNTKILSCFLISLEPCN